MKKEYLNKIKEQYNWFFDNEERYLILGDDLDSLLSCLLMMQYNSKLKIGYFYDYQKGLYANMNTDLSKDKIGSDISLVKGKCISNHMSVLNNSDRVNTEDLNMNIINNTTAQNYFYKYNLNTFLLVASLYEHEFKSDKARALSLLPDSSFLGYYYNSQLQKVQKRYLEILGYEDVYKLQEKHPITDFYKAQSTLNTKVKLYINQYGEIVTSGNINLKYICKELGIEFDPSQLNSEGFFYLKEEHRGFRVDKNNIKLPKDDMYAFTCINRNEVKFMKKVS